MFLFHHRGTHEPSSARSAVELFFEWSSLLTGIFFIVYAVMLAVFPNKIITNQHALSDNAGYRLVFSSIMIGVGVFQVWSTIRGNQRIETIASLCSILLLGYIATIAFFIAVFQSFSTINSLILWSAILSHLIAVFRLRLLLQRTPPELSELVHELKATATESAHNNEQPERSS